MQSIYQGVVDMLLVLNTDLTIRHANAAFEEISGYREAAIVGRSLSEFFQSDANPELGAVLDRFAAKGKCLNVELLLQDVACREVSTSCSFSYLLNNQHEKEGILIIAKDITELKQKEQELKEAKNKAEAANEAKSEFLSSMSHEIRTPLNGILGFTNLLMGTPMNSVQAEYVDLIKTSGSNLTILLNDILDLHRIEQDRITIEAVPFDIRDIISSHLQPYGHLAESKGLAFSCTFGENVPQFVIGDPTRINQVLINLVSNAVKFTETGSIAVHCTLAALKENDVAAKLKFTVTDTGIGIPAEKQGLIFESFTQSDQSMSRKYGGSGLGLTISKKLANLMAGNIGLTSPPASIAQGTCFWFDIEVKLVAAKTILPEEDKDDLSFALAPGVQILIVDDNPINVLLMQEVLRILGAVVTTAHSGEEAVEKVLSGSFALIFMDIQMPGMDGLEAARRIRAESIATPIVAFSANAYQEDIEKSIEAGMNDHLCKPFTNQDVIETLKKWV
nr:PAS domain-containing sensor histidine kinase [Pontibacter liquoris]